MGWIAKNVTEYRSDKRSLGKNFRSKRIQPFIEMIADVHLRKGSVSILDIGGTVQYWKIVDEALMQKYNVTITLLNLPSSKILPDTERIRHINGDATQNLWENFDQASFDLIHSNSVLEHVGDWQKMKLFAHNITSFDGGYYVQTPNYWFPMEPHCTTFFFHWLPKPIRVLWVQKMSLGHWPKAANVSDAVGLVDSARLLDKSMFSALFGDARIISERLMFFTKSFSAIRPARIK